VKQLDEMLTAWEKAIEERKPRRHKRTESEDINPGKCPKS
jgi:hypothetical protein